MPSDRNHKVSRRFFQTVRKKNIVIFIPMLTLFEILQTYFRISGDRERTDQLYAEMIEWNISKRLHLINLEATFLVYFTAFHHLFQIKTSDAVIALTAHRLKIPLVTWDKKLLYQTKNQIDAFTPKEFLTSRAARD